MLTVFLQMTLEILLCCSVSQAMSRGRSSESKTAMEEVKILSCQLITAVHDEHTAN